MFKTSLKYLKLKRYTILNAILNSLEIGMALHVSGTDKNPLLMFFSVRFLHILFSYEKISFEKLRSLKVGKWG